MNRIVSIIFITSFFFIRGVSQDTTSLFQKLETKLACGWNTWSYGSMLTHVLLPQGLAIKINFRNSYIGTPYDADFFYEDITVDKSGRVRPVAHTFDGSYTDLIINNWYGNSMRVQSATVGEDVFLLISPLTHSINVHYFIELQSGMMWNREGNVKREGERITATIKDKQFVIRTTGQIVETSQAYTSPYFSLQGDSTLAFYTGQLKTLGEISRLIDTAKDAYDNDAKKYGDKAEAFKGIQSVLGWNSLYDADKNRVITPVTRGWNEAWQGFVLFEWDTYFASLLFALDNKELAYSNAMAVTKVLNKQGAVGFTQMPRSMVSQQSQPPIGSMACWMLYEKYHDKWFLEEVYRELLSWNRWWIKNRLNKNYLTWGAPWKGAEPKHAILESGLDNSPMYEDIKMVDVGDNSLMNLADVGLMSLYVADCKYLSKIALVLDKKTDHKELLQRANNFTKQVQTLWDEDTGMFLNKDLDENSFSHRLSPTLFYPLMAGIPNSKQAARMLKEHYFNPEEFYGEYIIPSCARNDKSFDNNYWRGAIWGPMNFLVYLGLRDYDQSAATQLAQRSYELYLKAWNDYHYVFENINSDKGVVTEDDNSLNSDPYYHWGALMGLMKFWEEANTKLKK